MASAEALEEEKHGEGPACGAEEGDEGEEVKEGESAEETTGVGKPEEKEPIGGEAKEGGGKRKRGRKLGKPKAEVTEKVGKKRLAREAKPSPGRPTRERKTVERFSQMTPRKAVVTNSLSIQKGSGTQLKDIPNVFFKLSKRKVDENLQRLHSILFAKKAKALYVKRNIYQFSGFVWTENEEKQRAKVKEKLDKCMKDRLLDFCDVLDVPISRATSKKEDISAKLLEFLEFPCIMRDVMLAEKEQKRRKRKRSKGRSEGLAVSDTEAKEGETSKRGRAYPVENVEDDGGDINDSKDVSDDDDQDQDDKMEGNLEDSGDEVEDEPAHDKDPARKRTKGTKSKPNLKSSALSEISPEKITKISKKSLIEVRGKAPGKTRKNSSLEQPKASLKESTKQKGKTDKSKGHDKSESNNSLKRKYKKNSQPQPKVSARERAPLMKGKEKSSGKDKEPTREEIRTVVHGILKEVDFNTATLADILKQLGSHFSRDLMHRKAEIKSIIEEVINDMTDDEEDEGEEEKSD